MQVFLCHLCFRRTQFSGVCACMLMIVTCFDACNCKPSSIMQLFSTLYTLQPPDTLGKLHKSVACRGKCCYSQAQAILAGCMNIHAHVLHTHYGFTTETILKNGGNPWHSMASLGDENFPRSPDKSRGVSGQPGNFQTLYGISIV